MNDYEKGYCDAQKDFEKAIKENEDANWVLRDLYVNMAYSLPAFWYHNPKLSKKWKPLYSKEEKEEWLNDYKVIWTRYGKGYMKGLEDIEERYGTKH